MRCDIPNIDPRALRDSVDEEDVAGVEAEEVVVAAALGEAGGQVADRAVRAEALFHRFKKTIKG